jgi:hypothetical protein
VRALVRACTTYKGISLRVIERLHGQVNVELGPVEVVSARHLDFCELSDRGLAEPRKLLEWNKHLPPANEEPEAVR